MAEHQIIELPTISIIHPKNQALLNQMGETSLHSYANMRQLWLTASSPNRRTGHEQHTSPQGWSTRHPRSTDQKGQQHFSTFHVLFLVIFFFHLPAGRSFQPQRLLKSLWAAIVRVLPNPRLFHLTFTLTKQNSSRISSCSEHCWVFPLFHSHFQ